MMDDRDDNNDNAVKVTVMDRLVAELAGIETALVSLQDQVGQTFFSYLLLSKTKLSYNEDFKKLSHLTLFCREHHYGPLPKSKKL